MKLLKTQNYGKGKTSEMPLVTPVVAKGREPADNRGERHLGSTCPSLYYVMKSPACTCFPPFK